MLIERMVVDEGLEEASASSGAGRGERVEEGRRPYVTPHLESLGDVRDVTLGGSIGTGDSTGNLLQAPPRN